MSGNGNLPTRSGSHPVRLSCGTGAAPNPADTAKPLHIGTFVSSGLVAANPSDTRHFRGSALSEASLAAGIALACGTGAA